MERSPRRALVVEGGAMRGVFAAGVLSRWSELGALPFDLCIGVSSGAFALSAYLAGVPDAGLQVFTKWALSPEFLSFGRFLRGGHLLDIDWLAKRVRDELNLSEAVARFPVPLYVCVTEVASGTPHHLRVTAANIDQLLRATTALPLLYRGFPEVQGMPCTDGGASDAIPLQKALQLGATQVVVIRSRPNGYKKSDTLGHRFIRWKLGAHPELVRVLQARVPRHVAAQELIRRPPPGVQVVDVCPPDSFTMGRFGRDRDGLRRGYSAGRAAAEWVLPQLALAASH
jgi:predicted patatin/cPLA2 family phospholipase